MPTIIDYGGKGAALSGAEYDTNLTLPVTAVTNTPFTVTGVHNRNTLELKSGSDVVDLTAYATLLAEDTGDFEVTIKNRSGSSATISAAGVETFDGVDADITLADGASITLKAGSVPGDFMRTNKPDLSSVAITGGTISGITDLAITDGGTGASTALAALANLGFASTTLTFSSVAHLSEGTAQSWAHGLGSDDVMVMMMSRPVTGTLANPSVGAVAMRPDGACTFLGTQHSSIVNPDRLAEAPPSGSIKVNVFNSTGTATNIAVRIVAIKIG